jgi:energy-coupling factor transport system substrate-specific component
MKKYHFTTKDLVTIALISALGGVLSTYVGYLGNMMNHIVGVPFGAGQFMAGLHVVWIVLALGITRKKGAATATGLLKGIIELFMGSTHGIVIVVVSLVQGLIPDLVLFRDKSKTDRNPTMYAIAGGLSAASNVVVFQLFFFSGVPVYLITMLCMLAAASGIIFGGWLALEMLESLEYSGLVLGKRSIIVDDPDVDTVDWERRRSERRRKLRSVAVAVLFLSSFTIGAVYYFAFVFVLPGQGTIEVSGMVQEPYEFSYSDFEGDEVTITAELIGSVTYVAPRDYTGIRVSDIIDSASPDEDATQVVVTGSDGYFATFDLSGVMNDDSMIVILEDDAFRLVAADYEGAYWVEDVVRIEVR